MEKGAGGIIHTIEMRMDWSLSKNFDRQRAGQKRRQGSGRLIGGGKNIGWAECNLFRRV
jgi:hypothetical protein